MFFLSLQGNNDLLELLQVVVTVQHDFIEGSVLALIPKQVLAGVLQTGPEILFAQVDVHIHHLVFWVVGEHYLMLCAATLADNYFVFHCIILK